LQHVPSSRTRHRHEPCPPYSWFSIVATRSRLSPKPLLYYPACYPGQHSSLPQDPKKHQRFRPWGRATANPEYPSLCKVAFRHGVEPRSVASCPHWLVQPRRRAHTRSSPSSCHRAESSGPLPLLAKGPAGRIPADGSRMMTARNEHAAPNEPWSRFHGPRLLKQARTAAGFGIPPDFGPAVHRQQQARSAGKRPRSRTRWGGQWRNTTSPVASTISSTSGRRLSQPHRRFCQRRMAMI